LTFDLTTGYCRRERNEGTREDHEVQHLLRDAALAR
jgi:hypothetical protein